MPAVPWVSVLKVCMWKGLCACKFVQGLCGCSPVGVALLIVVVAKALGCKFRQKRFELTIVTREVLRNVYRTRSREPGEGKGGVIIVL